LRFTNYSSEKQKTANLSERFLNQERLWKLTAIILRRIKTYSVVSEVYHLGGTLQEVISFGVLMPFDFTQPITEPSAVARDPLG